MTKYAPLSALLPETCLGVVKGRVVASPFPGVDHTAICAGKNFRVISGSFFGVRQGTV